LYLRGNIDDLPLAGGGNVQDRAEHRFTIHPAGCAGTKRLRDFPRASDKDHRVKRRPYLRSAGA
jgi:hypothetical protein